MTEDDTDDVALFSVNCEQDGRTWRVPVFLSPLFRILHMGAMPSVEDRREMVIGLGAQAIAEYLVQGVEPPFEKSLVFSTDYPGSPSAPNPLASFDQVTVCDGKIKTRQNQHRSIAKQSSDIK